MKVEPLEVIEAGFKAWRLDHKEALKQAGIDPDSDASVASWVVQAPWAHPFWFNYWLYICHLRPMADQRPTIFYLPDATHEIWVHALDPKVPLQQMIDEATPRYLTPMNFAAQLRLESDAAAETLIRDAVTDVLNRRLNPDTDAIRQWRDRFGDNMRRTGRRGGGLGVVR